MNRLHDLNDSMSRDRNFVESHDFALDCVKMFMDQSDTDALGNIVLVQQVSEVLKISSMILECPRNVAD